MRHADSIDRANPLTRDHERSITEMGQKAAAQVRSQMWLPCQHVQRFFTPAIMNLREAMSNTALAGCELPHDIQ